MKSNQNFVSSQSLQAGGVSGPLLGRPSWNGAIAVQVYTFGHGVTIEADRSDLVGREGVFELEAFGKFFTFDMASAIDAQGLVAPIEGNVAAVNLPLQAMDQKDVAKIESHGNPCVKTVIVALPHRTGKTTLAEQMMVKFGCTSVVEEWCNRIALSPGALHLTNQPMFEPSPRDVTRNNSARAEKESLMSNSKSGGARTPAITTVPRGNIRSELLLISALSAIVHETMDYSPVRRLSDSYLPAELIEAAQVALSHYGLRISPEPSSHVESGVTA